MLLAEFIEKFTELIVDDKENKFGPLSYSTDDSSELLRVRFKFAVLRKDTYFHSVKYSDYNICFICPIEYVAIKTLNLDLIVSRQCSAMELSRKLYLDVDAARVIISAADTDYILRTQSTSPMQPNYYDIQRKLKTRKAFLDAMMQQQDLAISPA